MVVSVRVCLAGAVAVFSGVFILQPAASVESSSKPIIKCINIKSGKEASLGGTWDRQGKCPSGWAPIMSGNVAAAKRKAFLGTARSYDRNLSFVADSVLFGAGRETCRILDRGGNFETIVRSIYEADLDASMGAALVAASVQELCPGHTQFLNNYLGN